MTPKLSIIIPCYNSEATLENTLKSVMNQFFEEWEVLIINDGSVDNTENIGLRWSNVDKRIKYYSKSNEGLGKARNFGIHKAEGEYILPLDSDNLVEQNFSKNAIEIFESNSDVGVVHGHAEYFGERSGIWNIDKFNLEKILVDNYIDACAIYRKELWLKSGGYDEGMPYQGFEDWEFWIALGVLNVRFHHLNMVTFKYCVSSNSMVRSFTNDMAVLNRDYIVKKYCKLYYRLFLEKRSLLEQTQTELKSEKFVFNSFTKMFFGFKFFKM